MTATRGRLQFADWLRAWALLIMIETHVFNAFLAAGLRERTWFQILTFINGLVAPSFLFVSGFVFLVAAQKKLEELRALGASFWKQTERIGVIWAIAYGMHLSATVLYRVDVLHCIAATWLFLLLSVTAMRAERLLRIWLAAWAVCMSGFAPLVYGVEFRPRLAAPLAAYLNVNTGSLFPLFPWSAFMLAGALCASWFLACRERRFMTVTAALGVVMVLLGKTLPSLSPDWRADPATFLLRLGIVLMLLTACWLYGLVRQPPRSLLLDVSRQSLFVYVVHLMLIYAPIFGGASLVSLIGKTRTPVECALGSVLLAALMIGGARGWSIVKWGGKS